MNFYGNIYRFTGVVSKSTGEVPEAGEAGPAEVVAVQQQQHGGHDQH